MAMSDNAAAAPASAPRTISAGAYASHVAQFAEPYRSTIWLDAWLAALGYPLSDDVVLDLGCGMGAPLAYFAKQHRSTRFLGIDDDSALISEARTRTVGLRNVKFEVNDFHDLSMYAGYATGVLSVQVLSWLPHYGDALRAMLAIRPRWIAISSLFYEGPVECSTTVREFENHLDVEPCRSSPYNVYSLPRFRDTLHAAGYTTIAKPFEIDRHLPRSSLGLGTYTLQLADGSRAQFSGPLHLPWYFILAIDSPKVR